MLSSSNRLIFAQTFCYNEVLTPLSFNAHREFAMEVRIVRVHIDEQLQVEGHPNYIDPARWKPMIMNFCEYFGLGQQLSSSRLAPVFGPK